MPSSQPLPPSCHWFSRLSSALDPRSAPRLAWLFVGVVLARGRRTVTSWIRAAGLSGEYRLCYTTVAAGKRTDLIAAHLVRDVVKPLVAGADRLTFALDDTQTERYGRHVQGAGVHHNPTPGPAGGPFVYGHVWVVLGLLAGHPAWGVIALPLLARLYVRRKNLAAIAPTDRPPFRTKLELGVELVRWAKIWLGMLKTPVWVVTDGAYASTPVPQAHAGSRGDRREPPAEGREPANRPGGPAGDARSPADLRGTPDRPGQAGRAAPRVGDRDVHPVREGHGQAYKTFVATWRPAGGAIRVVLVDEPTGQVAFFCTDTAASVADILGVVANRFSLEIAFRDCKDVVGAGQQQVRRVQASVGAFHACVWTFTMTEAWAWGRENDGLVGHRSASPWDDESRRPSHADKRRAWRRELLAEQIHAVLRPGLTEPEIRAATERLLDLAAGS